LEVIWHCELLLSCQSTIYNLTFEIIFSFRNHIKSLWFDIQNTASSQLYDILNNDYFNGCKNNFVGYLLIAYLFYYWIDYPSIFHKKISSTMIFSMGNTSNVKKVLKNETKLTCWFFCSHLTHKNNKNADFMSLMNIVVLVTSIDHLPLLVFSWSDLVKIHPNPGKKFHSNYLWVWFI